ncbi:GTP cyclohydrolase [Dokdonia sp. Dokd-P16]|uniref:GTP cyclohydrolase n=1 Tax=Dokdonia sp. Dokd-P16 TaxID=2173169 RepID=UPI000D54AE1D|nr:GTP cyclohydrolase [Dokdonia sp. Dokd-P16]AWH73999.1 GTP cyclohydrolase [Dokdonia sp. Dokd-P16]
MIVQLAEGTIKTKYGVYKEILFYDGVKECHALVMGDVSGEEDVLCRVHSSCIFAHHFNSIECDCREQMEISQQLIEREGKGIVIWLEQEGKGNGHYALLNTLPLKKQGMAQADAYEAVGFRKDNRDFSAAAKILKYLEVSSITMITGNEKKTKTLTDLGITVSGIQATEL